MNRSICLVLVLCGMPTSVRAYIDTSPALGKLVNDATNIVVMQVDKVSADKRVIVYKKLADLKGVLPYEEIKQQITDGVHPREPKTIMGWAEPERIAIGFYHGKVCLICIGRYWYECAAAPSWVMVRGRPELAYSYAGSTARLRNHISAMLAGNKVVITVVSYAGTASGVNWRDVMHFKSSLRGVPLLHVRASLEISGQSSWVIRDPRWCLELAGEKPREDVSDLVQALKDPKPVRRVEAAEELAWIGPPAKAAVPDLVAALDDKDPLVRLRSAGALARIEPSRPIAVATLRQALKADVAKLRQAAAEALGDCARQAPEDSIAALAEALKDADATVRGTAADSLARLGAFAKAAVPALTEALRDREIRAIAADALGAIGPPAKSAVRALSEVVERETDPVHRWTAAVALVRIDPPAAIVAAPVFAKVLKNSDRITPNAFERATKGPFDDIRLHQDATECLTLLGRGSEAGVLYVAGLLRDDDPRVRQYAAYVLGKTGPQASSAIPALTEALNVPDMRADAGWALKRITAKKMPQEKPESNKGK